MDVLTAATLRTLRRNPVRTAATLVGIALSCALVLAVATSALSFYRYLVDVEVHKAGAFNASVLGATASQVEHAAQDPAVDLLVAVEREGYALVNEANTRSPYLAVEGLVTQTGSFADFAALVSLCLVEGAYPQGPDDLLLPDTLRRSGVLDVAVGERVTFDLGHRVDPKTGVSLDACDWVDLSSNASGTEVLADLAPRTFTVCGFYADNVPLFTGDAGSAAVAGIPAFTVAAAPGPDSVYQAWYTTRDPQRAQFVAHSLFAGATAHVNTYLNMLTSYSLGLGVYQGLTAVTVFLLVVVAVSSVVLVRNSFAISVTERTRQFGLLASVGATPRQLRSMVVQESLLIAALAIPLGVALGYGGTAVVLAVCGDQVASWAHASVGVAGDAAGAVRLGVAFSPAILAFAVALTLVTAVVSAWGPARRAGRMSPIEAIRSAADVRMPAGVRRSGRVLGRLFGVEGAIAAKSFCRAARPRRATVASLVVGTVLVVTSVLLGTYAQVFLSTALAGVEDSYDLRYHFYDNSVDSDATPREALDVLAASQDVTDAVASLQVSGTCFIRAEEGLDEGLAAGVLGERFLQMHAGAGLFSANVQFVDDAAYAALLDQAGVDPAGFVGGPVPSAVAVNAVEAHVDGKYARIEPFAGEPFEVRLYLDVPADSPYNDYGGVWSSMGYDTNTGFAQATFGLHRMSFEVGAFVDAPVWWVGAANSTTFVLPISALEAVDPALAAPDAGTSFAHRYWVLTVRSSDPAATQESMEAHLQALGLSDTRLYNFAAMNQSSVALLNTVRLFVGAFAAIVTLIAVTGAFNCMHTGVGLRRREFAVLRSVGMTRRGLVKMLAAECLVYGLHVLAWATPLACLASWVLRVSVQTSVAYVPFAVPWAVVPCSLGAFLVVAVATAYAVRRYDAGSSPVAALRTETA